MVYPSGNLFNTTDKKINYSGIKGLGYKKTVNKILKWKESDPSVLMTHLDPTTLPIFEFDEAQRKNITDAYTALCPECHKINNPYYQGCIDILKNNINSHLLDVDSLNLINSEYLEANPIILSDLLMGVSQNG